MTGGAPSVAQPRVLVLTAHLGRSGVPVVLERYLRHLPEPARAGVRVLARRGGPVAADLLDLRVDVTVLEPDGRRSVANAAAAAVATLGSAPAAARLTALSTAPLRRSLLDVDVVLVHGAGGIELAQALGPEVPVVVHLHELDTGLSRSGPPEVVARWLSQAQRVLAVSAPVADLAVRAGAGADVVGIVPGVVDPARRHAPGPARARLGPVGRPVVAGLGAAGWRKGSDRMVTLGWELRRRRPEVRVVWVGDRPGGADTVWAGATDPVEWLEASEDPWALLAGVDVVVVPSREDPLPLAALEAGLHGRAVVGTRTGGLPDLLGRGRGRVVGTHDPVGLLDAVEGFLADRAAAAAAGGALAAEIERHYVPDAVVPGWWETLRTAAGA